MEVAASLDAQVYSLEMERALRKPGDITAWEAAMRSLAAYRKYDPADRERHRLPKSGVPDQSRKRWDSSACWERSPGVWSSRCRPRDRMPRHLEK